MEFRLYYQMLRRGWWIIVVTTLAALVAALAFSYLATPQYKATARFIVTPSGELVNRTDVLSSLDTLDRASVISTYAEVMNSERIYTDALSFLQLQPTELEPYTYEAIVVSNSSVLELNVSGPNAQRAAELANAIGFQTINFTRQLNQIFNVDFLDVAVPPPDPFSPIPLLNISLAVALGLIVGAALAILNEQLRLPLEVLRQRRYLDDMTGVYNAKYFTRLVDEELNQHPDNMVTVGIVEMNGLRDLVDTLPIVSLQRILQRVTETLRNELRGHDVIGRWDDISFITMLPNTAGSASRGIFDRIFQALASADNMDQLGATVELDFHIGAAESGDHISPQELFGKANSALETARRDRNKPVYVLESNQPSLNKPRVDK